jgi:hypothetical protein
LRQQQEAEGNKGNSRKPEHAELNCMTHTCKTSGPSNSELDRCNSMLAYASGDPTTTGSSQELWGLNAAPTNTAVRLRPLVIPLFLTRRPLLLLLLLLLLRVAGGRTCPASGLRQRSRPTSCAPSCAATPPTSTPWGRRGR